MLGERIKQYRENKGVSVKVLADNVGTTRSWLSQIENGHVANPGIQIVAKISKALGVPIDVLVGALSKVDDKDKELIDSMSEEVKNEFALHCLQTGKYAFNNKVFNEAVSAFGTGLSVNPTNRKTKRLLLFYRGSAWCGLSIYGAGIADIEACARMSPDNTEILDALATAHTFNGDVAASMHYIAESIRLNTESDE